MLYFINLYDKLKIIKRFGIIWTIKLILNRLGIRIYPKIKYPYTDYEVRVNYYNYASWQLISKGKWELNCLKLLLNLVKRRQTIVDIGAHIGSYTLLISKLVGENGRVYAFEPDKLSYNTLKENIKNNYFHNVICENKALGDIEKKKKLYLIAGGGDSRSSLILVKDAYRDNFIKNLKTTDVLMTTIDKYFKEMSVVPKGFIIDVEGAEKLVVKGGKETFKRGSSWILLEFHSYLMSEKDRILNWNLITDSAKKIIYIDGNSEIYHNGMELNEFPNCTYFHVFIQY